MIQEEEVKQICRTCALQSDELVNLFNPVPIKLSDILSEIISEKVDEYDGLPQFICNTCAAKLMSAYEFRTKCLNSYKLLRTNDFMQENTTKCNITNGKIDNVKFKCPTCSKLFSTMLKLAIHLRDHVKKNTDAHCEFCGVHIKHKKNLNRHLKIHTGEKKYKCNLCPAAFIQSISLQDHMHTHSNELMFKCNRCDSSFKARCQLSAHRKLKHPNPIHLQFNYQRHPCKWCDKVFNTKYALWQHFAIHKREYNCKYCGKKFTTKYYLKDHIHIHTGEKNYGCQVCNKKFTFYATLKRHELIHSGRKLHQCEVCLKQFNQYTHYTTHMRLHTGEKPYKCEFCNKAFSLKGNLTVHIRIHTGERPYVCSVCNKGFYDSSSMKKHKNKHNAPNLTVK